jgi:hypothetical protein
MTRAINFKAKDWFLSKRGLFDPSIFRWPLAGYL